MKQNSEQKDEDLTVSPTCGKPLVMGSASQYKVLDLFCCAGGAGMGFHQAGFEVIGIDIEPQPKYPFQFIQADAIEYLKSNWQKFDAIHGSPPCQGYSNLTPKDHKHKHEKMIDVLRAELLKTGKPFIIENVAGARHDLIKPIMLCGSMFKLRTQRHRYFETSFEIEVPYKCDHSQLPLLVTTASKASREKRFKLGMKPKSVGNAPLAYGIDWMDFKGLKEAIPPAYTKFIGSQLLLHLQGVHCP